MADPEFWLVADVNSDNAAAIEPVLRQLVPGGVSRTDDGFHVEATMTGPSAKELNRTLLSALRRAERRTRLRAEWTAGGVTERFFDYVPKERRAAKPTAPPDPSSLPGDDAPRSSTAN